jgi:hypothetical protein
LVEQNKPHVEAWFREDETTWKKTLKTQIEDSILLRSIGASILLYRYL